MPSSLYFASRMLTPNTYVITGAGCDCYLLLGTDEALLIDSGTPRHNLRAYLETLTDLPVRRVINTHSHFDHTGGNGYFDVIYATEGIAKSAKNTMGGDPALFPLDYSFTLVTDGEWIELAGRPLQVIVLDCHAPGNLAVFDPENRMLFPGDEVEAGQVLLLPGYAEQPGQIHAKPAASVETYLHAMQKLEAYYDKIDWICPAHNGTPIDKSYLKTYITLAQMILDGFEGKRDCAALSYQPTANHFPRPEANYRRAEYRGASLVYCSDLIHDSDYAKADSLEPATKLHLIASETAREP